MVIGRNGSQDAIAIATNWRSAFDALRNAIVDRYNIGNIGNAILGLNFAAWVRGRLPHLGIIYSLR
jgi:hypothetical protein